MIKIQNANNTKEHFRLIRMIWDILPKKRELKKIKIIS